MTRSGNPRKGKPAQRAGIVEGELGEALDRVARERRAAVVASCAAKVGVDDAEDMAHDGFLRVLEWAASPVVVRAGGVGRVVGRAGELLPDQLLGVEWQMRSTKECERLNRRRQRQRRVEPAGLMRAYRVGRIDPGALVADNDGALYLWRLLGPLTQRIIQLRADFLALPPAQAGQMLPAIAHAIGRGRSAVAWRIADAKEKAREYMRDVNALVLTPWAWLRLHARRRFTAVLDDRLPVGWTLRELAGISPGVVVGLATAAVLVSLNADGATLVVATGRQAAPIRHTGELGWSRGGDRGDATAPLVPAPNSPATPEAPGRVGVVPGVVALASGRSASNETPGDTQLTAAAPAPDFDRSHRIVAVGFGATCSCTVLYQTTDAGRTWMARQAVPGAEQVVLPTDPNDRRIFLGTAPGGGIPPIVVDGIDGVPVPLAAPAGHVALAAGFDHGDDRVFVAAMDDVWSVDMRTGRPAPLLSYMGSAGVGELATAAGAPGVAVFVAVPPSPLSTLTGAPTAGVYACAAEGGGCELRSGGPPNAVTALASSITPTGGSYVVAVAGGRVRISRDGAHTFVVAPAAPEGAVISSAVSLNGTDLWADLAITDSPDHRVAAFDLTTEMWRDVTSSHAALAGAGTIVAIAPRVVLDLLFASGVLCTADDGNLWSARCAVGG